jgi:hypothetical protein
VRTFDESLRLLASPDQRAALPVADKGIAKNQKNVRRTPTPFTTSAYGEAKVVPYHLYHLALSRGISDTRASPRARVRAG